MKKPSSGLGFGLWVVSGMLGLYLLGACAILLAGPRNYERWANSMPYPVSDVVYAIYTPFFILLWKVGIL